MTAAFIDDCGVHVDHLMGKHPFEPFIWPFALCFVPFTYLAACSRDPCCKSHGAIRPVVSQRSTSVASSSANVAHIVFFSVLRPSTCVVLDFVCHGREIPYLNSLRTSLHPRLLLELIGCHSTLFMVCILRRRILCKRLGQAFCIASPRYTLLILTPNHQPGLDVSYCTDIHPGLCSKASYTRYSDATGTAK